MLPILFEDNHCLAVDKPAGMLSQGDATGDVSLVDLARADLKSRYNRPGNVYIGLIHRLDRPVSGIVLLARTSKSAARLSEQFRDRSVRKEYLAIIEGCPQVSSGIWSDILRKDNRENRVSVVAPGGRGVEAGLEFQVVDSAMSFTTVRLWPTTGRGHQLRVQLASRGLPIVGDRKYGASTSLRAADGGHRIALHAEALTFIHPTKKETISLKSPLPKDWPSNVR